MVEGSNPSEPVFPGGNCVKEKEKEHVGREFNPLQHIMVPKHEILNEDEIKELLSGYIIEKEQLPKIRVSDPAAVAAKSKIGDVIRITRESKTAGKTFFYRMVIA
jgi:DNA-directed RNA polymerase subunit H